MIEFLPPMPQDDGADPDFEALVAAYPRGSVGSVVKARRAWDAVPRPERGKARTALPRVIGARRAERKATLSLATYLENMDWRHLPARRGEAAETEGPASVEVRPFSRAAWAIFRRQLEAGKSVVNAISWIRSGATIQADAFPSEDEQQALVPVEVGSEAHKAWRDYGHRLGFTLPMPDRAEWLFLPSKNPPHLSLRWKGYHTIEPVTVEMRGPAWWWRIYQEGVSSATIQSLLDDRSHGAVKLNLGPIPLKDEIDAMIRIDSTHPAFRAWGNWFAVKGCKSLLSLTGPIYVPALNPAALSDPPNTSPDYEALDALSLTGTD